ncbi:hypothetical protein MMP65_19210 [Acinetobacter sp. ANC 3926]|uniref:Uncharacterized protein n=1 Tax=Acinetobacter genomosp. 15BJ TaxID=106651 RepID=R9AW44_9GAMM|nr:hypothetical protein [Acinetobacter genomosp. 15BJ]EOR06413.1 hypothetical protein F896_02873 [Acinetobacter genomosp. 15BJ]MCH7293568.1 hypothetical protein [Acinetobacter genomosp. 15BJ]
MESYLEVAEKLYSSLYSRNILSSKSNNWLNFLIKELKKEMVGTNIQLKFNYIYFRQGFKNEAKINFLSLDISLIPNCENKYEFILWLAVFIEKITIGGKKTPPAIKLNVPSECGYLEYLSKFSKERSDRNKAEILSGFNSREFCDNYKRYRNFI